jgi:hypothetical protein
MSGSTCGSEDNDALPSAAALRMRNHRDRRRKRLRCVTIELRESEIDLLIRKHFLAPEHRAHPVELRKAMHSWLDEAFPQ